MEKIPTAEEFLRDAIKNERDSHLDMVQLLIEFAQLHGAAIIKTISEQADLTDESYESIQEGSTCEIDKSTILNAYPLKNIK